MSSFFTPELFATLSVILTIGRYGVYLWSMYQGTTKPHALSWLTGGIIGTIATVAQYQLEGGPSVLAIGSMAGTCLFIGIISFWVGERNITHSDWITATAALAIIPIWKLTTSPTLAVVLVIIIDALSCYPTLRKCWARPYSEPIGSEFISALRYLFGILAVPSPTLGNLAYLVFLFSLTTSSILYLLLRRRCLPPPPGWTWI